MKAADNNATSNEILPSVMIIELGGHVATLSIIISGPGVDKCWAAGTGFLGIAVALGE
jgi:hypothetical protein